MSALLGAVVFALALRGLWHTACDAGRGVARAGRGMGSVADWFAQRWHAHAIRRDHKRQQSRQAMARCQAETANLLANQLRDLQAEIALLRGKTP